MRRWIALVACGCITSLPEVDDPCAEWPDPGLYSLRVDGRRALVDVPATAGPRPAVFMLHGARNSGQSARELTRFDVLGQQAGFVSVFPYGTGAALGYGRTWNAEGCCPPATRIGVDDVAHLDALAVDVSERLCVDRTFAAGFSNGSMMALSWACQGRMLDGVAGASGPLMVDACPSASIPVLLAHGAADPVVPFEGGTFRNEGIHPVASSDETLAVYLAKNGCSGESAFDARPGVTCEVFDCEIPVERCVLDDWGHRWPGGRWAEQAGYDLTRESWAFFEESAL